MSVGLVMLWNRLGHCVTGPTPADMGAPVAVLAALVCSWEGPDPQKTRLASVAPGLELA